jgi:putative AbiEii toxin of type IV toxin-antitoxin system
LCSNPEKALTLRQFRGNDPRFSGSPSAIVDAIYQEFFYRLDLSERPQIQLRGRGPEVRSLSISRGRGDVRIPRGAKTAEEAQILSPIVFEWTDYKKKRHRAGVKVTPEGLQFENTGESLPIWFMYAAQTPVASRENADRFAEIRKEGRHREIVNTFTNTFDWIEDIVVDSTAGSPVLSAVDRETGTVLPLTAVSGGVNRMASVLLAIAYRPKGIVLVDEIENGIFYTRHLSFCQAILRFAREYECQLFLTSHSQEWLGALIEAAGKEVEDISLWRVERTSVGPVVHKFPGRTFKAGIEYGTDIRG